MKSPVRSVDLSETADLTSDSVAENPKDEKDQSLSTLPSILASPAPKPIASTEKVQSDTAVSSAKETASALDPSGTFKARLPSVDLDESVTSVPDSDPTNSGNSLDDVLVVEASIGLDGRATASKLLSQNNEDAVCEPGGTFGEKLVVPLGAEVHGSFSKIKPGGSF